MLRRAGCGLVVLGTLGSRFLTAYAACPAVTSRLPVPPRGASGRAVASRDPRIRHPHPRAGGITAVFNILLCLSFVGLYFPRGRAGPPQGAGPGAGLAAQDGTREFAVAGYFLRRSGSALFRLIFTPRVRLVRAYRFVDTLLTDTRVDSFHDAHDMKHINHKQPGYTRRVCTGRTRRTAELGNSIDTRRRADDRIDTCIRSAIGWRLVKSHPRSTRCGIQVGAMTVGELGRAPPT